MYTLTEIKNTYAQEQGYEDWESLQDDTLSDGEEMESHMDRNLHPCAESSVGKENRKNEIFA